MKATNPEQLAACRLTGNDLVACTQSYTYICTYVGSAAQHSTAQHRIAQQHSTEHISCCRAVVMQGKSRRREGSALYQFDTATHGTLTLQHTPSSSLTYAVCLLSRFSEIWPGDHPDAHDGAHAQGSSAILHKG
jgi:hypothetical protein